MEASKPITISVLIPCYNQGHFLRETVESVLAQTYPHVEIVVVNDGSTDGTAAVAASFGDRIRCITKSNGGLSAARNTGILAAHGEFVHFLDSDDMIRPDFLQRVADAIARRPECHVFNSSWEDRTPDGELLERKQARFFPRDVFHALLASVDAGPPCCYTIRKSALANVGLFDVHLKSQEDLDMWLRLAAAGYEFVPVADAFAIYRVYPGSMSRNFEVMYRNGLAVLKKCRSYHRGCRDCASAARQGTRRQRMNCFGRALKHDLLACAAAGQWRAGFRKARRAATLNPIFLGYLVRESILHLCRRFRPA
jgi:glycosyltransferase involved in cell wall biosynthesis